MDKIAKKIDISFLKNLVFDGAITTPDLSKRLITSILLINNNLFEENLVILFQLISINMSKCPKNRGNMGKTAKN